MVIINVAMLTGSGGTAGLGLRSSFQRIPCQYGNKMARGQWAQKELVHFPHTACPTLAGMEWVTMALLYKYQTVRGSGGREEEEERDTCIYLAILEFMKKHRLYCDTEVLHVCY